MVFPSWADHPGSGLPDDYCAYNASSLRKYKPQSVIDVEARLKVIKSEKAKLENKRRRSHCRKCKENLELFVGGLSGEDIKDYTDHMAGGGACTPQITNVGIYNYWANINNWEKIPTSVGNVAKIRTIAGGSGTGSDLVDTSQDDDSVDSSGELGGGGAGSSGSGNGVVAPETPAPTFVSSCPTYAGLSGSVDVELCKIKEGEKDSSGALYFNMSDRRHCRRCLRVSSVYPSGRYSFCLSSEALIADLEDKIADLEDELEETTEIAAENLEESVCADCKTDNRSWFEKYSPMGIVGGLVGLGAYFASKSERDAYKYYKKVIHPDNNAKGYPTSGMSDRSGTVLATVLIEGIPTIIDVGLSTGAFGCSGSALFGGRSVSSRVDAHGHLEDTRILPGALGDILGADVNGSRVGANTNSGYTIGPNGQIIYNNNNGSNGAGLSAGQIRAEIAQNQQRLARLQAEQDRQLANLRARHEALARQYTYAQSYDALTEQYRAGISALGPAPGYAGSNRGFNVEGRASGVLPPFDLSTLTGGFHIDAHLSSGSSNRYYDRYYERDAYRNNNVGPRSRPAPSGSGINRL